MQPLILLQNEYTALMLQLFIELRIVFGDSHGLSVITRNMQGSKTFIYAEKTSICFLRTNCSAMEN